MVEFTNASSNATSYLWDFQGATSTDLNPVHIYARRRLRRDVDGLRRCHGAARRRRVSISSAVFTAADLSSQKNVAFGWRTATSWALAKTAAHGWSG